MSIAPHLLTDSRSGKKMGDWQLKDSMVIDGLMDAFNDYHMGVTAENVAKKVDLERMEIGPEQADQDEHYRYHQSGEHDEPYAPAGARYSTDPSQRSEPGRPLRRSGPGFSL